jgi:peptidoglycan/xylan/chitin deacetylase (PgdA/CDA1 family)
MLIAVLNWLLKLCGAALYVLHLHPLIMRLNRRSPKVLLFHACEGAETDFTRGLHANTTPARLRAQLDYLTRHYQIVPLACLETDEVPDYAVVLTFDDGYRSVKENALPLLRERGLEATTYLVTDVVGNHRMVWVNQLNWLLRNYSAVARPLAARLLGLAETESVRQVIEAARKAYDPERLQGLLAAIHAAVGIDVEQMCRNCRLYLDWDDVEEMSRQGMTFGNHTATHPNLAQLTEEEERCELMRARQALETCDGAVNSLAYPFGNFSAVSRELASELGFATIMLVGGANRPFDRHGIGRLVLSGASAPVLFAELEVVPPVKALVKAALRAARGGVRRSLRACTSAKS